jgi:hypothetical protein
MRSMIDTITESTDLAPVGSQVVNAHDEIISNPLFSGVSYPDKLESYFHQHKGPNGVAFQHSTVARWMSVHDKFIGTMDTYGHVICFCPPSLQRT